MIWLWELPVFRNGSQFLERRHEYECEYVPVVHELGSKRNRLVSHLPGFARQYCTSTGTVLCNILIPKQLP